MKLKRTLNLISFAVNRSTPDNHEDTTSPRPTEYNPLRLQLNRCTAGNAGSFRLSGLRPGM
jgi:hypothetical protein